MAEQTQTAALTIPDRRELDLFDPGTMQAAMELAKMLSTAAGWVPKHLLGNPGACLGIVSLSAAWRVNPFLLAAATSDIHGKLLFEAKAVQAGIEHSGALSGRLTFKLLGDWSKLRNRFQMVAGKRTDENGKAVMYASPNWRPEEEEGLAVEVSGTPAGGGEPVTDTTWLKACHPRNSTLWATDPETQCRYRATRNWARKCMPHIMLGAVSQDEYEETVIDVTAKGSDAPAPTSRLRKAAAPKAEAAVEPPAPAKPPETLGPMAATWEQASEAIKKTGCPEGYALDYLVAHERLAKGQTLKDASPELLAHICEHADKLAKKTSAWLNTRDNPPDADAAPGEGTEEDI